MVIVTLMTHATISVWRATLETLLRSYLSQATLLFNLDSRFQLVVVLVVVVARRLPVISPAPLRPAERVSWLLFNDHPSGRFVAYQQLELIDVNNVPISRFMLSSLRETHLFIDVASLYCNAMQYYSICWASSDLTTGLLVFALVHCIQATVLCQAPSGSPINFTAASLCQHFAFTINNLPFTIYHLRVMANS